MGQIVMPADLAEVIKFHRTMFGGFVMEAIDEPPVNDPTPPADPPTPPAKDDGDEDLGEAGKRALAAERKSARDALRRATDAEARLQAIEDANKTDLQKAQDAAAKAVADAQAAQLELSRERIARRHKLADEDAELLSGDEEQMERLAARLALAATPPATPPAGGAPKAPPVPGIGRVPETRNIPLSDQITAAEKAGDKALVATLKAMMLTSPGQ